MDPAIDQVLLPRYELLNVIGRGGHSVVYRAVDRERTGEVAIKMLHPSLTLDSAHAILLLVSLLAVPVVLVHASLLGYSNASEPT